MIELTVSPDAAGQRLDKYVRKALKDVPLSHVYKLLRTRQVRVNGARGKAEQLLAPGDQIAIRGDADRLLAAAPEPAGGKVAAKVKVTFRVLHEDADFETVGRLVPQLRQERLMPRA